MERAPSQDASAAGNDFEKRSRKSSSPETARETSEQPIRLTDIKAYIQYLIDQTREDVAKTMDAKEKERKGKRGVKFAGIASRISTQIWNGQVSSVEDLVASLEKSEATLNERLDAAYSDKNEQEIRRVENTLRQIEETKDFVAHLSHFDLRQRPFLEWQNALNTRAVEENGAALKMESISNAREVREAELLLSIVADGSAGLYASLPQEYARSMGGSGGFGGILDSRRVNKDTMAGGGFAAEARAIFGLKDHFLKEKHSAAQVREFVTHLPVVKDEYREIEISSTGKRFAGLFGSKTTKEKKWEKVGERPVLHNEVVANGKDEPVERLLYIAAPTAYDYPGTRLAYTDEFGRPGNFLCVEILLPKSEAAKIMVAIKENPDFIRKIVDRVAIRKVGVPEDIWVKNDGTGDHFSLRPPYEKWDAQSGGKIYIAEPGDEFGVFNPERVLTIDR